MTPERITKIARDIVARGIEAEMAREEKSPGFRDMSPVDQAAVKAKVDMIRNATAVVEFSDVYMGPSVKMSNIFYG